MVSRCDGPENQLVGRSISRYCGVRPQRRHKGDQKDPGQHAQTVTGPVSRVPLCRGRRGADVPAVLRSLRALCERLRLVNGV